MSQPTTESPQEFIAKVNNYLALFSELCAQRQEDGEKEYGSFTWLENDVIRMMAEELADTTNYCRFQFAKLMILQESLMKEIHDKLGDEAATLGVDSFKGVKKGWE